MNQNTFYLSPSGNDAWTGKSPQSKGQDGPWKTLQHAAATLRKLRGTLSGPVRVELRGGMYELEETLVLGPEDSCEADAPVTFAPFEGEKPVISGGRKITGWSEAEVNGRKCWKTEVPGVKDGSWNFTQLFVSDTRRERACLPKQGWYFFGRDGEGEKSCDWYQGVDKAPYAEGEMKNWKNLSDVRLKVLKHWFDQHLALKSVDEENRTVHFACRVLNILADESGKMARYRVENIFEALTEPGEWYLDRPTGILYYIPREGEKINDTEVIAPRLTTLIHLKGSSMADVSHIRFEGLDFRHTEWQYPAENPGSIQSAFLVPGAIKLFRARACSFFKCEFTQMATYGIEIQRGSSLNRIVACHFYGLGAGGVKINHQRDLEDRSTGKLSFIGIDPVEYGWMEPEHEDEILPAMATEVADCHIHDNGVIFNGSIGVWIGESSFNHVHHNSIHDQDYTGISCGWSWTYSPTFCVGNRIEYNHIFNIGRGNLSDMGALYCLGLQPGGIIRGNHIHHVDCYGYGGSGIYPDQGCSFLTIEDNIVHHTQSQALSFHYGKSHTVRNNIFALARDGGLMARGREESVSIGLVVENIIYGRHDEMLAYNWGSEATSHFNRNLYYCGPNCRPTFHGVLFDCWQERGHDRDSVIADPGFADAQGGDFTLPANSPAFALGFKALDAAKASPRHSSLAAASIDEVPLDSLDKQPILEPRLELGAPTFPDWKAGDALLCEPVTVYVEAGTEREVSLTICNRGMCPAQGTFEFVCEPASAVEFLTQKEHCFSLAPGERMAATTKFIFPGKERLVVIRAVEKTGLFPALSFSFKPKVDQSIRRIPAIAQLEQLPAAMSELTTMPLDFENLSVGHLKMAIAGDFLAIQLVSRDCDIQINPEMPWMGASAEIFVKSPETPSGSQQYIIYPGNDVHPAGAVKIDHVVTRVLPEPSFLVSSRMVEGGYELDALIPLEKLFLKTDVKVFDFDLFLHARPDERHGAVQAKLFGLNFSWMGTDSWGIVHVND